MTTALARSRRSVVDEADLALTAYQCRAVPSVAQRLQSCRRSREIRDLRSAVARVRTACKACIDELSSQPPRAPGAVSAAMRHLLVARAQLQFDRLLLWLQLNEPEPPASVPGLVSQDHPLCHTCTCQKCR